MHNWTNDPVLQGGGESGRVLREHDWSLSPLGEPSQWPPELRTLVSIALGSTQPMLIVWGPEQTTLYNDGYAAMCGNRHPAALGHSFEALWFDIWDSVEPIISAAYRGVATSMEDIQLTMHRNGYPEETHFAFSYTPVRDSAGVVLGMFCACTETTGEVKLRRAQSQEHERLLQVVERALGAIAILTGPDHMFSYVNSDYMQLIGHRQVMGLSVGQALPEVVEQGFIALLDRVYRTGKAYEGKNVPITLQRLPGGETEKRLLNFIYQPIRDGGGQVTGMFVQAIDVTEEAETEKRQEMLNRELGHRMKNQLAVVQAIINQTLRSAPDIETAGRVLNARVLVLARAHDILIAGGIGRTTVSEIVKQALLLHDDVSTTRFQIEGPDLVIASRPALSLSLILHELSTNAAKYGALSAPHGVVIVSWSIERNESGNSFVLLWREQNGPVVSLPTRKGAGSRLIHAGLAGVTDASVSVHYHPTGVECVISAELGSFQAER